MFEMFDSHVHVWTCNHEKRQSSPPYRAGCSGVFSKMNTTKITVTVQPPFGAELLRIIKATTR